MNSDLPFSGNAGKAHWIASITRRGCGRVVHPWSAFSMVWIEVIIVSIVGPRQTDADAVRDPCNPNRRGWRRLVQLSDDINRAVSRSRRQAPELESANLIPPLSNFSGARSGPHSTADLLYAAASIEAKGTSDGVKSPVKHLSTRCCAAGFRAQGVLGQSRAHPPPVFIAH
jgi:hypothetical protein